MEFQNQYLGFRLARDRLQETGPHADYTLSFDLHGIANRITLVQISLLSV